MFSGIESDNSPQPRARSSKLILLVSTLAVLVGLVLIAGPTMAETDSDGDGFTDAAEAFMGTDPLSACNATTTASDENFDAWPPDFNDDTEVDIADVVFLRSVYSSESGDGIYDPRFDLTADGKIDIADVVRLRGVNGSSCEPPPQPPPSATSFLYTFDGEPATPIEGSFYNAPGWDVSIQSRFDKETVAEMPFVQMGADCGPPPGTHFNDSYLGVVFICRNHLMTGINTGGYAAVYLTPDHMVDFSQGEAVIRFDKTTLITSTRDWTDFWITPFEDNVQFPLEAWQAFLAGEPRNSIHVKGRRADVIRDFVAQGLETVWWIDFDKMLARKGLAASPTRRDTIEIRISRDHLSYCFPDLDFCFYDGAIDPPLTWDKGVVQFGHHSYNPAKGENPKDHDCSLAGISCPVIEVPWGTMKQGAPNTWHWDNVSISTAVPFTIIHSDRRFVEWNDADPTVNFEAPAPANAFLRFMTMRDQSGSEISLDGGQTWVAAQRQLASKNGGTPINVWHPIPAGTTSIQVRAAPGARFDWFAFDFRIWSETVPD